MLETTVMSSYSKVTLSELKALEPDITVNETGPIACAGVTHSAAVDDRTREGTERPPNLQVLRSAAKYVPIAVTVSPPLVPPRLGRKSEIVDGRMDRKSKVMLSIFVKIPRPSSTPNSTLPSAWAGDAHVTRFHDT
jgi:hypothetical protein